MAFWSLNAAAESCGGIFLDDGAAEFSLIEDIVARSEVSHSLSFLDRLVLREQLGLLLSQVGAGKQTAVLGLVFGKNLVQELNFNLTGQQSSEVFAMLLMDSIVRHHGSLSAKNSDGQYLLVAALKDLKSDFNPPNLSRRISSEQFFKVSAALEKLAGSETLRPAREDRALLVQALLDAVPFDRASRELLIKKAFGDYAGFLYFSSSLAYGDSNASFVVHLIDALNAHGLWTRKNARNQFLFLQLIQPSHF